MYDQLVHVVRERPDLIVVNYARKGNRKLLEQYKKLAIRVVVLDTEGGILRSEYRELLNIVLDSGAADLIDDYLLWGHRQYRAFHQQFGETGPHLYLTGCPRFDLYAPAWSSLIPDPPFGDRNYVLFATSFPLNNPRFTTPEQEIRNVQETMGLDENTLRQALLAADLALDGFVTLVRDTCARFADIRFVLRPHPFEGEDVYTSRLSDIPNLRITREGSLNSWLKQAKVVVQLNSSVAFEAGLLGKPVVSLEMFQDVNLAVPVASACSLQAEQEDDYWNIMEHLLARATHAHVEAQLQLVREGLEKAISDWIYAHDGHSAERTADRLAAILAEYHPPERYRFSRVLRQAHAYGLFVAKLIAKRYLRPQLLANARLKQFHAQDFAPLAILWQKVGLIPVDRPLGGWWPFSRSNAVIVRKMCV
ncbi:MAG: surface carbohydrate biosynthesis protein, partial [Nitrospiraceae bacterium]